MASGCVGRFAGGITLPEAFDLHRRPQDNPAVSEIEPPRSPFIDELMENRKPEAGKMPALPGEKPALLVEKQAERQDIGIGIDQTGWRWPMPRTTPRTLDLNLTKEEKERIGNKVWRNESGGTIEGLTAWNKGEEFPSLGIGHFIWMPKGVDLPFGDSFPEMVQFLRDNGAKPPAWLKEHEPCPWDTRQEFMRDFNGKKLTELRQFLKDTVPIQTDFLIQRLEKALPKILEKIDDLDLKAKVQERFYRVLNSGPPGVFALVDYVNFKGEGLELVPEYGNISWGMRQVLEQMKDTDNPVKDFSDSAKAVLTKRVENSPKHRHEEQWLKGWHNRVDRYVTDPPFRPELKHRS